MSLTDFSEPQPSLAWQFESSNVDSVTSLQPSAQVSPGPAQLQGGATLVTTVAGVSNTAVYFPGTAGSYMNLGTSSPTEFNIGSSNLFIETWMYINSVPTDYTPIIANGPTGLGSSQENWGLQFVAFTATPAFFSNNKSVASSITPSLGTWVHIAASYNTLTSTAYIFVNGEAAGSVSGVITRFRTGITVIGIYPQLYTSQYSNMYIRDLRVVKGGVVPVATFTPLASAPFSYASPTYVPNMGTTVFTLLGQFVTYNPSGKYGSSLKIQNYPVGGVANVYTGWTSSITSNLYSPGLTVSTWIKYDTLVPGNYTNEVSLLWSFGDAYFIQWNTVGGSAMYNGTGYPSAYATLAPVIGTWYHCTSVYGNGIITTYINGSQVATSTFTTARTVPNSQLYLGGQPDITRATCAEFDDFRIYNTALTAAQVRSIYTQSGAPASNFRVMPQPRLAWDFNGTTTDYVNSVGPTVTNGSPSFNSNGKFGQSIVFNNTPGVGTNSLYYGSLPSNPTSYTISAWVKPLTLPSSGTSIGDQEWFTWDAGAGAGSFRFWYVFTGRGTSWFSVTNNQRGAGALTPNGWSQGTWGHITVVMQALSPTFVYFNGNLVSTISADTTNTFPLTTLSIAKTPNGSGTDLGANCELDDLRVYNSALSSSQIQSIYNQQGMPGRAVVSNDTYITSGLVAYYDTQNLRYPNSVSGTTWYDISGNGRSVTIRPGSSYNSSGKYITFDGTVNSGTTVAESGQSLTRWTVMCAFMQTANGNSYARVAGSSPAYDAGEIALFGQNLRINPPESRSWTSTSFTTTYNVWYHMCVAFDTTTTGVVDVWVYIDGALVNSYTIDGTVESLTGYTIGARNDFNNEGMIGRMSLFAIYNRVLSQSEVSANYEFYKKTQTTILDPSFESYFSLIGASGFLYNPSPSSWTFSNGGVGAVAIKSGNLDWGSVPAQDGQVFIGLQMVQTISQTISGLVPGGVYTVTWWQRARPTFVGNDINVSLGGTLVYNETNITVSSSWTQKTSSSWISPGTSVVLQFYTTNPLGSDTTTFIDNVSISQTFVPIRLTGTPLFNQLSPSATSSAVGAFSLRAVNGVSTRAVQVRPVPAGAGTPSAFSIIGNQFSRADSSLTPPDASVSGQTSYNGTNQYTRINPLALTPGTTGLTISMAFKLNSRNNTLFKLNAPYPSLTIEFASTSSNISVIEYLPAAGTQVWFCNVAYTTSTNIYISLVISGTTAKTFVNNTLFNTSTLRSAMSDATNYDLYGVGSWNGGGYANMTLYDLRIQNTTIPDASFAAQDFYADERGNLLTAPVVGTSLQNWLGSATGYVTKWYDQSGRGNHAGQTTAAAQPIIQRATKGPGYACLFNGANSQVLSCEPGTYSLLNSTKYAVCVTERRNNAAAQGSYFGLGSTGSSGTGLIIGYFGSDTNIVYTHRGDNLDNTVPAFAGASEPIRYTVFDYSASTTKRVYINSSILPVTNTSYDLAATTGAMTIGKSFGTTSTTYYYGEIYEILVFTKSLYDLDGTTSITQIYQNQLSYTGT